MPRKGETALTPEQQSQAIAQYRAGATSLSVATTYGVSDTTIRNILRRAGALRGKSAAQQLRAEQEGVVPTPEEQELLLSLYRGGAGAGHIAELLGWGRGKFMRVRRFLETVQEPLRGRRQAAVARWGRDVNRISAERWSELYWALGSRYPSLSELATRFEVSCSTIHRHLKQAGIRIRTSGEQERLDIRKGVRSIPDNPRRAENLPADRGAATRGRRLSRAHRERLGRAMRARNPGVTRPCVWCGDPVERTGYEAAQYPHSACCRAHGFAYGRWSQTHPDTDPRPMLLTKLRAELGSRPHTAENLERAALRVGAGEAEILAVLDDTGRLEA